MNNVLNTTELHELLQEAISSVVQPSASQIRMLEKLRHLQDRLQTEHFQLAVLGQFKRGKSTLLNALLGIDLLPTSVVPLTAIPTFLQAGAHFGLRITYLDHQVEEENGITPDALREQLKRTVTEESNPENRLGVERVDVFLPSPLLSSGVILIDTPGVGSTFRHNTATAEMILPECDAALMIVSPDPPITEVEIAYLTQIRPHVEHLVVVLNKSDTLEADDRPVSEGFLHRVLQENQEGDAPVFSLSARNAMRAIQAEDQIVLAQSGLPELESYLVNFLARDKQKMLVSAVTHKASVLVGELRLETDLILKALSLPIADLEERIARFDEAAAQFETQRRITQDLLNGDQKRLLLELEEEAEHLRNRARQEFERQLDQALAQGSDVQSVRAALSAAVPEFFKTELERIAQSFQTRLTGTLSSYQERIESLVMDVRHTAAELMDVQSQVPESREAFERHQEPYWISTGQPMTPNIIQPGLMDRLLSAGTRKARLRTRLLQEVDTLVLHNVENLRWATRQNIDDAFRRFGGSLDSAIQDSLEATRGAMTEAYHRRQQQAEQIREEIASRTATTDALKAIQERLQQL